MASIFNRYIVMHIVTKVYLIAFQQAQNNRSELFSLADIAKRVKQDVEPLTLCNSRTGQKWPHPPITFLVCLTPPTSSFNIGHTRSYEYMGSGRGRIFRQPIFWPYHHLHKSALCTKFQYSVFISFQITEFNGAIFTKSDTVRRSVLTELLAII